MIKVKTTTTIITIIFNKKMSWKAKRKFKHDSGHFCLFNNKSENKWLNKYEDLSDF